MMICVFRNDPSSNAQVELIYLPYILETNRKPLTQYIDILEKDYWADVFQGTKN